MSFPDPTSPKAHPLFWAIDLNCSLTDYAAASFFFDFLMEGNIDQLTGRYTINNGEDTRSQNSSKYGSIMEEQKSQSSKKSKTSIQS